MTGKDALQSAEERRGRRLGLGNALKVRNFSIYSKVLNCEPVRFGSVYPVFALQNRNRTGYFLDFFNRFNQFFLSVRFSRLTNFFAHP